MISNRLSSLAAVRRWAVMIVAGVLVVLAMGTCGYLIHRHDVAATAAHEARHQANYLALVGSSVPGADRAELVTMGKDVCHTSGRVRYAKETVRLETRAAVVLTAQQAELVQDSAYSALCPTKKILG